MNLSVMRQIWHEDDAIPRSHEDYEDVWAAYRRLTGQTYSYGDAEDTLDLDDEIRYLMPDTYVVIVSGAGASRIYAPPDAA